MIKAEIIAIGDELLIGQVLNTNGHWLSQELSVRGIVVNRHISISDSKESIIRAIKEVPEDVSYVIVTGGLGPTKDDITKHVLTEYFSDELVINEDRLAKLKHHYESRGRELNDLNKTQALLPKSAGILDNAVGTACGMWFKKNKLHVISVPGVPHEMKYLLNTHVFPKLEGNPDIGTYTTIKTVGIPESDLAMHLEEWESSLGEQFKLAYLPNLGQVRLRLTSFHYTDSAKHLQEQVKILETLIPEFIFGYDMVSLPESIGALFNKHNCSLATAESCTGGSVARALTSFSGSSSFFKGSIVAYHNEVKKELLGVSESDLDEFGAVSQQVVEQMAAGARKKLNSDYAVSTSGIAGPDGGTDDKPVGTIWIAVAGPERVVSKKLQLGLKRSQNIDLTVVYVLDLIRREFSTKH